MKIYTKTGDQGQTALWGGSRVSKNHPRVGTYGTVDEANSMIGLALTFLPAEADTTLGRLTRIQGELFQLGSELATQEGKKVACAMIGKTEIERLEKEIDDMESSLVTLKNFILPGGSSAGAALHVARTITRRAERECVGLMSNETGQSELIRAETVRTEIIQYLNRLSDYLFVVARFTNHHLKKSETKWAP